MSDDAPRSDACPRCGGRFHCGMHDAAPCACTTLRLDDALLLQLRTRWSSCLCLACLSALAGGAPLEIAREQPQRVGA